MSVPLATPCSFPSVCLVSKRLYRLCCVPEMLRELDVNIAGERALQRALGILQYNSQLVLADGQAADYQSLLEGIQGATAGAAGAAAGAAGARAVGCTSGRRP